MDVQGLRVFSACLPPLGQALKWLDVFSGCLHLRSFMVDWAQQLSFTLENIYFSKAEVLRGLGFTSRHDRSNKGRNHNGVSRVKQTWFSRMQLPRSVTKSAAFALLGSPPQLQTMAGCGNRRSARDLTVLCWCTPKVKEKNVENMSHRVLEMVANMAKGRSQKLSVVTKAT